MYAQSFPDSAIYNRILAKNFQTSGFKAQPNKPEFRMHKLRNNNSEQCAGIFSVIKLGEKSKLLMFLEKDSIGKWIEISSLIATSFNFIDVNNDGVQEIECIYKEKIKVRRNEDYRLISFNGNNASLMFRYHQFEYFNVNYIVSNIAPDSVFAEKHTLHFEDINMDGKSELIDDVEIKFRKLPCCEHHFEYGIRQKKMIFHYKNGKFEKD